MPSRLEKYRETPSAARRLTQRSLLSPQSQEWSNLAHSTPSAALRRCRIQSSSAQSDEAFRHAAPRRQWPGPLPRTSRRSRWQDASECLYRRGRPLLVQPFATHGLVRKGNATVASSLTQSPLPFVLRLAQLPNFHLNLRAFRQRLRLIEHDLAVDDGSFECHGYLEIGELPIEDILP